MTLAIKVTQDQPFRLRDVDPGSDGGLTESEASRRLDRLTGELRELQELIFAAECNGLLVVLQGMDASGKDVTISNVFTAATPESCRVKAFKRPTPAEEKHDFLWPAHQAMPALGELVIFDRSYYEQVLVPQVDGSLARAAIRQRFERINQFEGLLTDEGTMIVKFFLYVSKDEQERRLQERQDNIETAWKISESDWLMRQKWDAYMAAYEETVNACATDHAPWYIVPADHQWFHNLAVADALVEELRPHHDAWIEARDRRSEEERAAARKAQKRAS